MWSLNGRILIHSNKRISNINLLKRNNIVEFIAHLNLVICLRLTHHQYLFIKLFSDLPYDTQITDSAVRSINAQRLAS